MPNNLLNPEGHVCPWWLMPTFDNPLRHLLQPPRSVLDGLIQPGAVALDLGCGMGYFSIPMAQMVGASGRVYAVDLQPINLERVQARARRAGVAGQILTQRPEPERVGLPEKVDFALLFWMLHEVPDQQATFNELRSLIRPGGRLLLAEPLFHVSRREFERSLAVAQAAGWELHSRLAVYLSQAVLMEPVPEL